MKILLLMPDARMHKLKIFSHVRSMREAPLSLITLAALAPDERDIEWKVVDGSIDAIPFDEQADLVGISVLTGTSCEAYSIADRFRRRGVPVVLGGVHVSILPGEALQHADSIVIGMAETTWPRLIADFRRGRLQRVYREPAMKGETLAGVPPPRRDLLRRSGYMMADSVHATRGCRRACDFCTAPLIWPRQFRRPTGEVLNEIARLPGRRFCFNDINLIDDLDYARELFTALIPLRRKWGGLATIEIANHPDLIELLQRSGCIYLLIGFESVNPATLRGMHKGFNRADRYREAVEALHAHGIVVQGCFVFGQDEDQLSVFAETVERVCDLKIDIPRYSISTPYPGTPLFRRLEAEDRILSFNWDDYDTMHVVFQPKQMSPSQLFDGFKRAYRETFRIRRIVRRTAGFRLASAVNLIGNLTYRGFARRLCREPRFARPYHWDDPGVPPRPEFWHAPDSQPIERPAVASPAGGGCALVGATAAGGRIA